MHTDFEKEVSAKTDNELLDIYINQSQYQPAFVSLVTQQLQERNIPLGAVTKIAAEKENIDLTKFITGTQGSPLYIAICFCIALFGGIPAIVAGYVYGYSKHTGPDGNSYFVYNSSTRAMGKYMLALGVIVILYWVFRML